MAARPHDVWARVTSPAGVNHELGPWLRMTIPRSAQGLSIDSIELGKPAGRSWILLFGVLPVDYDDLVLAERDPGRRFLERSSLATLRPWIHERVVEAAGTGSTVTDRLTFTPRGVLRRVPGAQALAARIVGTLFSHRHRRLRAYFGAPHHADGATASR